MSPVTIGIEIEIVEEVAPVVAPTATDPCFLVHSEATEVVKVTSLAEAHAAFDGLATLTALADAFFNEGGAVLTVAPYDDGSGGDLADDLEQLPADLGPGQVVFPEAVTGADMAVVATWAYQTNRIYIADGPDGASDATLVEAAALITAAEGARFATMEADTLLIPGIAPGSTRQVPASIVKAALMARNDITTGNPNLPAAGLTNGLTRYVTGIEAARTETQRNALADSGINCFRTLYGAIVPYGYRTVADLDELPVWWDLSGSRTVMAVRAREAAVAEAHMFGQLEGGGALLQSYEAGLARELRDLQRVGALFARSATDPGYSVRAGWEVNPPAEIAQGRVRARITLRTSPFAEHITVSIIRRPITEEV